MSTYSRSLIKSSKYFYRDNFRRMVAATIVSFLVMLLLALAIFYIKQTQRASSYYATNTAGFITQLQPLAQPNQSSSSLLPPDPKEEYGIKKLTGVG